MECRDCRAQGTCERHRPRDAHEIARLLGIHPNTLKRISPADLPYFRVTRRGDRRYSLDDVEAYIADRMAR